MNKYNFQYCQKIVVFSEDLSRVLLCKRQGESDFDGTYSFIGGKLETTDKSLLDGLQREKNEEVGKHFKIEICPFFSTSLLFTKKTSESMVLPHYYARHIKGTIQLGAEYSDYRWVAIDDLEKFEPKIPTIPDVVKNVLRLKRCLSSNDLVQI